MTKQSKNSKSQVKPRVPGPLVLHQKRLSRQTDKEWTASSLSLLAETDKKEGTTCVVSKMLLGRQIFGHCEEGDMPDEAIRKPKGLTETESSVSLSGPLRPPFARPRRDGRMDRLRLTLRSSSRQTGKSSSLRQTTEGEILRKILALSPVVPNLIRGLRYFQFCAKSPGTPVYRYAGVNCFAPENLRKSCDNCKPVPGFGSRARGRK